MRKYIWFHIAHSVRFVLLCFYHFKMWSNFCLSFFRLFHLFENHSCFLLLEMLFFVCFFVRWCGAFFFICFYYMHLIFSFFVWQALSLFDVIPSRVSFFSLSLLLLFLVFFPFLSHFEVIKILNDLYVVIVISDKTRLRRRFHSIPFGSFVCLS